ncbi:hypothetical protein K493DRAFT_99985 [Basidiobolus meristosporus CBS 931.73]|uniref:EF-hand n=1 Tax=Basidiobolus meristosporus CBS 931.73 TaxID=1314790 RepID=A0A1Y1X1E7_9FUNG|nr:hypothetical protein K493DRAFT_99985 [Basidiobolus meristosporus CBS 931.73]|eukprot:ORX79522.1 hypothetical protein K493DRAFT_99985 [Basidiobolus meristosporus CBS 931.73]
MSLPNSPGVRGLSNPPLAPFTAEDRVKFARIFNNCNPQNGQLDGDTARDLLMKTKLPIDVLGQIWNLADTQNRGRLDQAEFSVAMYFVQHYMNGNIKVIPNQLPAELLSAARGAKASPQGRNIATTANRSNTFSGHLNPAEEEWVIKPEEKAKYDRLFATVDLTNKGYITGEEAVQYFSRSKLSEATLAQIWDLADISQNGQLNREEFAVSLHLIQMKLSGSELPPVLPRSFIPPTMRKPQAGYGSSLSRNHTMSQAPVQSSPLLDLHKSGLGFVSPPTQNQPARSLTSTPVLDSAEISNFPSHLGRPTAANAEREQLEHSLASVTSQRKDVEKKYSQLKGLYDVDVNVIQGLQESLRKENEELQSKRSELSKIEQEYNQLQLQKNILQEEMDKDIKESNEIKQKIKQLNEEIVKLKADNERMTRENKQQKNLLQVNRGQLASVSAEKKRLEGSPDEHQLGGFPRGSPNLGSNYGMGASATPVENAANSPFNLTKSPPQHFLGTGENFKKSPPSSFPSSAVPGASHERNASGSSFNNIFPAVNLGSAKEKTFNSNPGSSSFSSTQSPPQSTSQSHSPLSFDNPMFWTSSKPADDQPSSIFFPKMTNDTDKREPLLEERTAADAQRVLPGQNEETELELDMNKAQIVSPKNEPKPYGIHSGSNSLGSLTSSSKDKGVLEKTPADPLANLKAKKNGGFDKSLLEFDTAFNSGLNNPADANTSTKLTFDDLDFNAKFPTTDRITSDAELAFSTKASKPVDANQQPTQPSVFDFEGFGANDAKPPAQNDLDEMFGGAANMSKKPNPVFDDIFGDAFAPTNPTNPTTHASPAPPTAANPGFDDIFAVNQPNTAPHFDLFGAPQSSGPSNDTYAPPRPAESSPPVPKMDSPHSSSLRELTGMGFTQEQAQMALERYDYDLNKATNFLLDQ